MASPQTPSPPHLYSQELQLKLYQAFIFSIPILFSIILFLLFYLFYLKRRFSNSSSSSAALSESSNQAAIVSSTSATDFKETLKEKLPVILFDEDSRARETLCCVCLGEFKVKDELRQLPSCKHFFHFDCIRHWLHSNSTCPICRCSVIIATKNIKPVPETFQDDLIRRDNENLNQSTRVVHADQQEQLSTVCLSIENCTREERNLPCEGSSRPSNSVCIENSINSHAESFVINIQTHDT